MARQVQRLTLRTFENGMSWPPLQTDTLRLYSMRFCPYAQRPRLVLAHKNVQYETVNVHLKRKPSWLFDRNPKGRVPVLEHPDGRLLYESVLVSQYLDDLYPQQCLTPSDPFRKARDLLMVDFCEKLMTATHRRWTKGSNEKVESTFHIGFNMYEKELQSRLPDGPFFGGKDPTLADYMIWPWLERVPMTDNSSPTSSDTFEEHFGSVCVSSSKFPQLYRWMKAMYRLPAVQETMFDLETHVQYGISHRTEDPIYDIGLDDEPPLPSFARL